MLRSRRCPLVVPLLCLMILGCGGMKSCGGKEAVSVRTWHTVNDAALFPPELKDPELRVPWLQERPSFGIAFSGGGTRSASATLGQLRALHDLGWLKQARYISANSGGTWATVPYTYLPADWDEERFLGEYVPPEEINDAVLKPEGPAGEDPRALGTAIHDAETVNKFLAAGRGDEAYSHIVGEIFLAPFGLDDNEKFFTFHRRALDAILAGNPDLREEDFYIVERQDRPYLILVGTMLAQQLSEDPEEYFPVEMTPLYTGIRKGFSFEKDEEWVTVGGGYIESFGYDSYEPKTVKKEGRFRVRLEGRISRGDLPWTDRYQFTLADAIGISSAAPLVTLSGNNVPNLLFPELRHWPVDREAAVAPAPAGDLPTRRQADEYQHGDGGDIDNLALMPLLVRQMENILVFINTAKAFQSPPGGCGAISEDFIKDDLVSLFRTSGKLIHNVVIDRGEVELQALCEVFREQQGAGRPLSHCAPYDIVANPRHGIEPYRANLCWMYLDRVGDWLAKVDPGAGELNRRLHAQEGPFDNFPHLNTFAEQGILLIDLDRERVNALSNLTAWTVYESEAAIRAGLPGVELP